MEEEYNWDLIIKVATPISLIEAYVFYTNISNSLKWFSLIAGLMAAGSIVYFKDKKKSSIFTAIGIVFLAALVVRFLRNFGFEIN
ncbi:hypothetical protein HYY70_02565 [Candidatus Woesearchaeota archaeon]|nr:hypothetical protein [Candidatus Woesearchaeota archaeon]